MKRSDLEPCFFKSVKLKLSHQLFSWSLCSAAKSLIISFSMLCLLAKSLVTASILPYRFLLSAYTLLYERSAATSSLNSSVAKYSTVADQSVRSYPLFNQTIYSSVFSTLKLKAPLLREWGSCLRESLRSVADDCFLPWIAAIGGRKLSTLDEELKELAGCLSDKAPKRSLKSVGTYLDSSWSQSTIFFDYTMSMSAEPLPLRVTICDTSATS